MTAVACPSGRCPCSSCAGDRARAERAAQGLPELIEDEGFYALFSTHLNDAARRRAS